MKQPEALRLAESLERDCEMSWPDYDNQTEAAVELRRLHEANQAMLEALKAARHMIVEDESPIGWSVDRIDEAIAKGEQS